MEFTQGFAITPSDTVDIKDDIANLSSVPAVFVHNVATGATVRVMPAGVNPPAGFTLTGSSGTANITVSGIAYLVTYTSSLSTSATNFVNSWAATLAGRGITVSANGARLVFTGAVGGGVAIANVSGDLSGTALAATPITIFIPQGGTSEIAVKRVYNTTPAPPAGLIGYHSSPDKC